MAERSVATFEDRVRATIAVGDPDATDRLVAEAIASARSVQALASILTVEPLETATFGVDDDEHGVATASALLDWALRRRASACAGALRWLATIARPDIERWLRPDATESLPQRVIRARVEDVLKLATAGDDARVRAAAWVTVSRAPSAASGTALAAAFARETDVTVRAAMWLAWAVHPRTIRGSPEPSIEVAATGLLAWAATFAQVRAQGELRPDDAERLMPRRSIPRLPATWAFATDEGPATVLDLAHALVRELDVDASLVSMLARTAQGPGAARQLATWVFGPFVERPGSADIVFTALPRAGLCATWLTPLQREALATIERLGAEERDPHLGWALGVGVSDTASMLAAAAPFFVPLEPPMPGRAGATFWHLWRSVVLGDGPSVGDWVAHLRALPPETLAAWALARMQRVVLHAQIRCHGERAACLSRDAAILDALGEGPRLRPALIARLAAYRPLGADAADALGRMVRAAGLGEAPGAAERIADALRVYG